MESSIVKLTFIIIGVLSTITHTHFLSSVFESLFLQLLGQDEGTSLVNAVHDL